MTLLGFGGQRWKGQRSSFSVMPRIICTSIISLWSFADTKLVCQTFLVQR